MQYSPYRYVIEISRWCFICWIVQCRGVRHVFAHFWSFIRFPIDLHWILQISTFQVLKAWNIVYKNMKTSNPSACSLTLYLKIFSKFSLANYFSLRLMINAVLFRIETMENLNRQCLSGVKCYVRPPGSIITFMMPPVV